MVTYQTVKNSEEIATYIRKADETMIAIGYNEHSFAHVTKCAEVAGELLLSLDYDPRTAELARIAGYMHDIGNAVNRVDHAQSGALMSFRLLDKMGMPAEEVATVMGAIGHHDEGTAAPISAVAAALILADKSDVRRSRVRGNDPVVGDFDIHDRVNYAVEKAFLDLRRAEKNITLDLSVDTSICAVMDYFEIFLGRMLLCRRAANFFDLKFQLIINGACLL